MSTSELFTSSELGGWIVFPAQSAAKHNKQQYDINQKDEQWDRSYGNKIIFCYLFTNNSSLLQIKPKSTFLAMSHRFKTQELYLSHAHAGCEVKCKK